MKCHVRIEITHSKRGVMQGFTTHSALETLRLRLRVTNIAIRCKTLHNPTLVVCYFYSLRYKYTSQRERMTSSLTFFPNSVRQATSTQREKPVLQVRARREGLPKLFMIKSSFYVINFLAIIYSSILKLYMCC